MKTILEIQNLKGGNCKNIIERKLANLDFIYDIEVNNKDATVSLEYETFNDLEIIKRALAKLGYPVIDDIKNLRRKAKSHITGTKVRLKNKTKISN